MEFIGYLTLLCFIGLVLCTVIGVWGIILFTLFFTAICFILYIFRYTSNYPASLATSESTIVWSSSGHIISIVHGPFFRLVGTIVTIECGLLDGYTHVSPIYGTITKVIHTDTEQYSNGLYIQIVNNVYQVAILICSNSGPLVTASSIAYVTEGQTVYTSQPLCLCTFGSIVRMVVQSDKSLAFYNNRPTHAGEMI